MKAYDIVIIGGGPAGLAAAISAKKSGADSILILERDRELGGILNQCIHNGFGLHTFKEELTGPEYAGRFIEQVKELGIEYKLNTMVMDISHAENRHSNEPGGRSLRNPGESSQFWRWAAVNDPRGALKHSGLPSGRYFFRRYSAETGKH